MAPLAKKAGAEATQLQETVRLLGGSQTVRHPVKTPLDVHEVLARGLPAAALQRLVDNLVVIHSPAALEQAIGMSVRTIQRRKKGGAKKPLSREQSGRTWKFAEILAKATAVLGSQQEAEQWLERPAIGLDQRRPIDLLATPAGAKIVEDFLTRVEFGVYA
jgi:putative toxin-antitoxin system antitoxin component (TIGR02293 family)